MKNKRIIWIGLLLAVLLAGCSVQTAESMYLLPKRPEGYSNLQSLIEESMRGLEYSAPVSGRNRQTVQMADLNGDKNPEYILFAKSQSEKPLNIFVFTQEGESFRLVDTIRGVGSAFDQVEYVEMDHAPGVEIVIGTQLTDGVLKSLAVYSMRERQLEQIMNANYSNFLCSDLNDDKLSDIFVLRPGTTGSGKGAAELYSISNGTLVRSHEVDMSEPVENFRRILAGRLQDGKNAIYVASDVTGTAIITDVYALVNDTLTNVSLSIESGSSTQTLRNYYVYADDIDDDAVVELPEIIAVKPVDPESEGENQYIIRWFSLTSAGQEIDKMYTYHNFVGGWYIRLMASIAERVSVVQKGSSYEFYLWDPEMTQPQKLFSVFVLTGQKREEQAVADNRFVLYRTDSIVYAAKLEVIASNYATDRETLISGFHLIQQDWNSGLKQRGV